MMNNRRVPPLYPKEQKTKEKLFCIESFLFVLIVDSIRNSQHGQWTGAKRVWARSTKEGCHQMFGTGRHAWISRVSAIELKSVCLSFPPLLPTKLQGQKGLFWKVYYTIKKVFHWLKVYRNFVSHESPSWKE